MKKHGKIWAIAAAVVACLTMALGLAACNGGTPSKAPAAATVSDVYTAKGSYSLLSKADSGQPVDVAFYCSAVLTTYSDNSYMLTEVKYGAMPEYGYSQVGQFTSILYGTFTQSDDEYGEVRTIELGKPTHIIYTSSGTYLDTDVASTFTGNETWTAESLLAKGTALTLSVDIATKHITSGFTVGSILGIA